ncbi:MAG: DedA family protein [Deltaproteobacteria bacterium]|nr:DedA family protein [Deltaproteobacteria bacterium]
MEALKYVIEIFLHLDKHLNTVISMYGVWTYLILFLIIFCETGLVVTPVLPGDSLLFTAGSLAAVGPLDPWALFLLLSGAAILGDTVNYSIGRALGPRVFQQGNSRIFKKAYLDKTRGFYEKYGGKTIILARFVPIVRTFAPFVAGVGVMSYARFVSFNIAGGVVWIGLFVFGGYLFGGLPVVKQNFTAVILAIIFISIIPGMIGLIRHKGR